MELQKILQRFNVYDFFKCYIITIICLILFQNPGYSLETKSNINDNNVCDNCYAAEISTTTIPNKTRTPLSFTEGFIERRIGRYVDFKELLTKYSSICPIEESCGVGINPSFLYFGESFDHATGNFKFY